MTIDVVQGDITVMAVDAIVNAANPSLLGGGGVDGAIHRAAGPGLLAECRALPELQPGVRCPTGQARITGGHKLLTRNVIHTVGPVWQGGMHAEPALLAGCYRESLQLAVARTLRSIAFPAISCGVFGYPPDLAVPIAVREARAALQRGGSLQRVVFCCFDAAMARRYHEALAT